jgi:hypothetical protein
MWPENCFVTLTYGRGKLPPDGSLEHRDFQLFFKRLRKCFDGRVIRFYMCGEYGPLHFRPHYHACLFNVNFSDLVLAGKSSSGCNFYHSDLLCNLWGHGIVSVQDLTSETAGYCARYIMKKVLGRDSEFAYSSVDSDGVIRFRKPEYAAMSLKPGIGFGWFAKYGRDIYPHDFAVADGVKFRPPKYYDKLMRSRFDFADEVQYERVKRALKSAPDQTEDRRRVREIVHTAKVRELKRGLE